MNKGIIFTLLMISSIFSSSVSAAFVSAALCDNCTTSQARQLALITGGTATRFGVTVLLGDFSQGVLYKFFLLDDDNPLNPEGEIKDFYAFLDEVEDFPDILDQDIVTKGDINRTAVAIAQLQPTFAELKDFQELDRLVDFLESRGLSTRQGGPPVVLDWNVPSGVGFDSAFDVIDFINLQRQLGNVAINASPIVADAVNALSTASDIVNLKSFLNLDFSYKFIFPDGSTGLFVFNNQRQLEAVPGSFQDSELNNIPESASDVAGMSSSFGGGSSNIGRLTDRVGGFGFSVSGSSGGGGSCTFQCNSQSCTLTCKVK